MSNDVLVTGNLTVLGSTNFTSNTTSNITNDYPFTITNVLAHENDFLVGNGTATAEWTQLKAKHFESYDITTDANVTLTNSSNIFQSLRGNGGSYVLTLPTGSYGTTFIISKFNSTNSYQIKNGAGTTMSTYPSTPVDQSNIYTCHYPNNWDWFKATGHN